MRAGLAAEATQLISSERNARVEHLVAVDPDRTGLDAARHFMRGGKIAGPHAAAKAKAGRIGAGQYLVDRVEGKGSAIAEVS